MILPSKFLPAERSLIVIGGEVLNVVKDNPQSVSEVWERMREAKQKTRVPLGFDWFVLAVTLLFAMGTVELKDGLLTLRPAVSS
ncbi:hypothetical protein CO665_29535 [Rhizobium anhuiense]|uniref:ABC-three component system middle component 6 n=1 Tax=Rhizobium anhuiense TaxID=1184720 RepID=UPI000BE9A5E8|nr:ABC-three component system middle component 6 [Rhizobium anhuiense]PDS34697.1 hypothetical protein CO665_29535 [Rhizobium anhuiense]